MSEKALLEEVQEAIERPYSLRKLNDGDLFPLLSILRKIGLKEFKNTFNQTEGETIREIGVAVVLDMASVIIEHLSSAESEIYALCSSLSGLSEEEIKAMEFGTMPLMIYDAFSEVKNTSFFKVLFKLL